MHSSTTQIRSGLEFHFTDTGRPSQKKYTTIFTLHGMCFDGYVFESFQKTALARGLRVVSINRRDYTGSSPLTDEEKSSVMTGTDEDKSKWLLARGTELATFIATFAVAEGLPLLPQDRSPGGFAILGWSVGALYTVLTAAGVDSLAADLRDLFVSNVRALIFHEPAPVALGLTAPPKMWTPFDDQSLPAGPRFVAFAQWLTGYFDHGDLNTHDLDVLSYWNPSNTRTPSIFNMSPDLVEKHLYLDDRSVFDTTVLYLTLPQTKAILLDVLFGNTRKKFKNLKIGHFTGDRGPAFGVAGMWAVQDQQKELAKEGAVRFEVLKGGNHFALLEDSVSFLATCEALMA